jgi:y4mF family transcriptional regulator
MNAGQLGALVTKRRQELRIDQATLAGLAGVSIHTVSNLEQGRSNPTLKVVERVLDALGLELTVRPRGRTGAP